MTGRCIVLLIAAVLAGNSPCRSQTPLIRHTLDSGRVVRVYPFAGVPEAGRLVVSFAPDSTTVRYCLYYASPCRSAADNTWRARAVSDIARLDVKVGSRAGRGFLIGAGSCATVWAFVAPYAGWPDWTDNPANLLVNFLGGFVAFAPTCGGLGALIGAQKPVWGTL